MSQRTELLIYSALLVFTLVLIAGRYELDSRHSQPPQSPSKPPTGYEVMSIGACKASGFTTVAKFAMRGTDQILVLSCGAEKIPND